MSIKASVSMSPQQDAFIRKMVKEGRFSSASAVVQQGLELLRQEAEREEAELMALQAFFEERRSGPFEDSGAARSSTQQMIARKRELRGL